MGFALAFALFAIGVSGLFYLDRDKAVRNSPALWLPVIWLWIIGSRPPSDWLQIWIGFGQMRPSAGLDAQLDGSPVDAIIFLALFAAAVAVLHRRSKPTVSLLGSSLPVLIYFFYCAASCLWSPFPDVAFKRWIKDVGDLAMVLVIATDPDPLGALRRIFSRVGFVLFPASILLIRYSPLGRAFGPDGSPENVGVTTNKNTLGLITFVVLLGAVWSFFYLLRAGRRPNRIRRLLAQGTLIAFGIAILQQAHSDTSTLCFALGALLMMITSLSTFRRHPRRVHALVLTILLLSSVAYLMGGEAKITAALGKNSNLSDRTIIWAAVIPLCPDPVIGAGFESFWNGYGKYATKGLSRYERGLNSAHDGYIEVYLNLGLIGVGLIAMLLFFGYQRAYAAFRLNPEVGNLMLASVATVAIYNITEAGFRILTPTWMLLLLVLVGSRSIAARSRAGKANPIRGSVNRGKKSPAVPEFASAG
jgi:exopolysaccharide production protein ExoQ